MGQLISSNFFPQFLFDCNLDSVSRFAANDAVFVLDSVLHVMNISLPINSVPKTIVLFQKSHGHPTCYNNSNLIILSADICSWDQIAYQFTHEMCHRVIPNPISHNLRWLEESICEMASYYFLPKISKYWKRIEINKFAQNDELYFPYFASYAEESRRSYSSFDLSQLCALPETEILKQLASNPYIRDKNSYIAGCMLPFFKKHPLTWHAIPYLCNITSGQTLSNSLFEWIKISPLESQIGLNKIAQMFGLS